MFLCQFKRNKVREGTDSDSDGDENDREDEGLVLRQVLTASGPPTPSRMILNLSLSSSPQSLAVVLVRFITTGVKCHGVLRVCLRTLRILSRDKKVLGPLVTDAALLTLAKLAGLTTNDAADPDSDPDGQFYDSIISSLADAKASQRRSLEDGGGVEPNEDCGVFEEDADSDVSVANSGDVDNVSWTASHRTSVDEMTRGGTHHKVLERGRKDRRESKMDGNEELEDEEEAQRKEAMKVLCNVVYNSTWAQERFSSLRWGQHAHDTHTQHAHDTTRNMHTNTHITPLFPAGGFTLGSVWGHFGILSEPSRR